MRCMLFIHCEHSTAICPGGAEHWKSFLRSHSVQTRFFQGVWKEDRPPGSLEVVWGAYFLTAQSSHTLPASVRTAQLGPRGKSGDRVPSILPRLGVSTPLHIVQLL